MNGERSDIASVRATLNRIQRGGTPITQYHTTLPNHFSKGSTNNRRSDREMLGKQDSPLLILSEEIVLLMQGAQVVDLAGVVEVMLDHHRDDPARLLQFTPVRHP